MTPPPHQPAARPPRKWLFALLGAAALAAGATGWYVFSQVRASHDLREGEAALSRDDLAAARDRLAACLRTRPRSGEAHFFFARACRRAGDLAQAARSLQEAERFKWDPGAVELERALLAAQGGNVAGAEKYLARCVAEGHPDSLLIFEVLVPPYIKDHRLTEARAYLLKWVEQKPDAAQAWVWLGEVNERVSFVKEAAEAYDKAVNLAPENADARLRLAKVLLKLRQAVEALPHFEYLVKAKPRDPEVRLGLARCWIELGRTDEARGLLDELLKQLPRNPELLAERGRLELEAGRAAEAEPWLRQAVELKPYAVPFLYTLLRCYKQMGKDGDAREVQEKLARCEADLKRAWELTKAVVKSPHDAELRYEVGVIFLRNSQEGEGVYWLQSALRENPRHAGAHEKLAEFYERTGQKELAERHRAAARPAPFGG